MLTSGIHNQSFYICLSGEPLGICSNYSCIISSIYVLMSSEIAPLIILANPCLCMLSSILKKLSLGFRLSLSGLRFYFYPTYKLVSYLVSFMEVIRRHKSPGLETKDFCSHHSQLCERVCICFFAPQDLWMLHISLRWMSAYAVIVLWEGNSGL